MTMELAVDVMRHLLQTGLLLSIPILGTATVVGLLVSFVQSITSLQEQTLTFVPKLICVSLAIVIGANFILKTLTDFCILMFDLDVYFLYFFVGASCLAFCVDFERSRYRRNSITTTMSRFYGFSNRR